MPKVKVYLTNVSLVECFHLHSQTVSLKRMSPERLSVLLVVQGAGGGASGQEVGEREGQVELRAPRCRVLHCLLYLLHYLLLLPYV